MSTPLQYNLNLTEKVDNILLNDFWILEHLDKSVLPQESNMPFKFSATASIFVRKGEGVVDINLQTYMVKAPCIVNIKKSQVMQVKSVSPDLEAGFIVMSNRFCDNLFLLLKDSHYYSLASRCPVVQIPDSLVDIFNTHYKLMAGISAETSNRLAYQAQVLGICSFFYRIAQSCYFEKEEEFNIKLGNRITDQFIHLVEKHFKEERFLDFYASRLDISSKHLSRTLKAVTGFTAGEWIERFVVLEAKVLLKSTNLNIQQISDELNFPSQSFFGKYFKKCVGISPKEFRNT